MKLRLEGRPHGQIQFVVCANTENSKKMQPGNIHVLCVCACVCVCVCVCVVGCVAVRPTASNNHCLENPITVVASVAVATPRPQRAINRYEKI